MSYFPVVTEYVTGRLTLSLTNDSVIYQVKLVVIRSLILIFSTINSSMLSSNYKLFKLLDNINMIMHFFSQGAFLHDAYNSHCTIHQRIISVLVYNIKLNCIVCTTHINSLLPFHNKQKHIPFQTAHSYMGSEVQ